MCKIAKHLTVPYGLINPKYFQMTEQHILAYDHPKEFSENWCFKLGISLLKSPINEGSNTKHFSFRMYNELDQPSMIDDQMIIKLLKECKADLILIRKALAILQIRIVKYDFDEQFTYIYTEMNEQQYQDIRYFGK
jgi:hypothetical protein